MRGADEEELGEGAFEGAGPAGCKTPFDPASPVYGITSRLALCRAVIFGVKRRQVWVACSSRVLMIASRDHELSSQLSIWMSGERRLPACSCRQPADNIRTLLFLGITVAEWSQQAAETCRLAACAPRTQQSLRVFSSAIQSSLRRDAATSTRDECATRKGLRSLGSPLLYKVAATTRAIVAADRNQPNYLLCASCISLAALCMS